MQGGFAYIDPCIIYIYVTGEYRSVYTSWEYCFLYTLVKFACTIEEYSFADGIHVRAVKTLALKNKNSVT